MKKVFKVCDLDCANCAMKMERGIKNIDGVTNATVSFMSQKIIVEIDEGRCDEIVKEMKRVCAKIEPDCKIMA